MKLDLVTEMGRLNRIRFLAYTNILILTCTTINVGILMLLGSDYTNQVSLVMAIVAALLATKFAAQRYRDVSASGWWSLFYLTPAQPIIYIVLGLLPGSSGVNKYGSPNPDTSLLLKLFVVIPINCGIIFFIWLSSYH